MTFDPYSQFASNALVYECNRPGIIVPVWVGGTPSSA